MDGKIRIGEAETEAEITAAKRERETFHAAFSPEGPGLLVKSIAVIGHRAGFDVRGMTREGYITDTWTTPSGLFYVTIMVI